MRPMLSFAVLLLLGLSVRAADAPADGHLQTIAPYVNDLTFLVAHVDVARVDLDLAAKYLKMAGVDQMDKAQAVAALAKTTFLRSGGKDVYVLLNWADPMEEMFIVVIPLAKNAAAGALAALVGQIPGLQTEVKDNVLLAGPKKGLARLKNFKAQAVPNLAKAFTAMGEGTAEVVFVPPFALKRAFVELHPVLPKEIGGGNASVLDFQWAAVRVDAGNDLAAKIVIQTADAKGAEAMAKVIERALALAAKDKEVKRFMPEAPKIIALLTPKVEADRLTLTFDNNALTTVLVRLIGKAREGARQSQSINNLKQLGLAMHNFHDSHKAFPPVSTYDANGRPLLSWRVYILPYIEQDALFKEFHLNEPWDSDHNKKLSARMPETYKSPAQKNAGEGKTTYLVPVGAKTIFGGKKGMPIQKITDGTSNTIMIVETDDSRAVYWTQPDDYKIDPMNPMAGLVRPGAAGFNAAFADGSVRLLPGNITPANLHALYTANGGEIVDLR